MTDACEVKIGSYIDPAAKNGPLRIRGLYLKTAKGEAVELVRSGEFGTNIRELGLAIADFAQIKGYFS